MFCFTLLSGLKKQFASLRTIYKVLVMENENIENRNQNIS